MCTPQHSTTASAEEVAVAADLHSLTVEATKPVVDIVRDTLDTWARLCLSTLVEMVGTGSD